MLLLARLKRPSWEPRGPWPPTWPRWPPPRHRFPSSPPSSLYGTPCHAPPAAPAKPASRSRPPSPTSSPSRLILSASAPSASSPFPGPPVVALPPQRHLHHCEPLQHLSFLLTGTLAGLPCCALLYSSVLSMSRHPWPGEETQRRVAGRWHRHPPAPAPGGHGGRGGRGGACGRAKPCLHPQRGEGVGGEQRAPSKPLVQNRRQRDGKGADCGRAPARPGAKIAGETADSCIVSPFPAPREGSRPQPCPCPSAGSSWQALRGTENLAGAGGREARRGVRPVRSDPPHPLQRFPSPSLSLSSPLSSQAPRALPIVSHRPSLLSSFSPASSGAIANAKASGAADPAGAVAVGCACDLMLAGRDDEGPSGTGRGEVPVRMVRMWLPWKTRIASAGREGAGRG